MNVAVREGLADLRNAQDWDMGFVKNVTRRMQYQEMATKIVSSLEFLDTCGMKSAEVLRSVDLFTSHEGLHLEYEEAMTSAAPASKGGRHYNLGAHFLWIGDRTRQLDHAHVEYFRGIVNPVGIKVGPTTEPAELVTLIQTLNPSNMAGKVTLITRFGVGKQRCPPPPPNNAYRRMSTPKADERRSELAGLCELRAAWVCQSRAAITGHCIAYTLLACCLYYAVRGLVHDK